MRGMNLFTKLGLVGLVAAALTLAGCGGGSDSGGGGGSIIAVSGHVVDDGTLAAVAGARVVAATGESTTTDATGLFNLSGLADTVGTLTVTKTGYGTATASVTAGGGDQSVGFVYLPPALSSGNGKITGVVTASGSAVGGAVLTAGGQTATSRTTGVFTIYNVAAGAQTVQARSSDGLQGGSASTTVVSGGTSSVSIALTTSPPPPPPI